MSLLELRDLQLRLGRSAASPLVLRRIDLSIAAGEAVGLVGESGSGKTLTARAIARILPAGWHLEGTITFDGTDVTRLAGRKLQKFQAGQIGMVFQDPAAYINPVHTIGYYLTETLRFALGQSKQQAMSRAVALLAQVGLNDPHRRLRQYPHELSGGQLQRVMIAGALAAEPRLILADEPTTALDVTTQAEVVALLDRTRRRHGAAMLFITHDLELAGAICDRVAVMYAGEIVEIQTAHSIATRPAHPYTAALYEARPHVDRRVPALRTIPGAPLSPLDAPAGCAFAPRCGYADQQCTTHPGLVARPTGAVRCVHADVLLTEDTSRTSAGKP